MREDSRDIEGLEPRNFGRLDAGVRETMGPGCLQGFWLGQWEIVVLLFTEKGFPTS